METKKRVLVVDDELGIGNFLSIKLGLYGYDVVTTTSGAEAVDLVKTNEPDIMLLDILMPDVTGLDVLEQVRAFSQVPIIIFTGRTDVFEVARKLGANDHIAKPFDPDALLAKIQSCLVASKTEKKESLKVKRKILLVDDERGILNVLRIKLDISGYEVVTASNGKEALDRISSTCPDLVLLDVIMHEIDGFDVLARVRAFSKLPVIMFSARPENAQKALSLGANGFISKPLNVDDLVKKIDQVLAQQASV